MVTGETPEGDFPTNIEGRIKTLLTDPTITYDATAETKEVETSMLRTPLSVCDDADVNRPDDKVRIVLLYRNYKGPLSAEDKVAIGLDKSGLNTADMQALSNMDLLGANKDSVRAGPTNHAKPITCTDGARLQRSAHFRFPCSCSTVTRPMPTRRRSRPSRRTCPIVRRAINQS